MALGARFTIRARNQYLDDNLAKQLLETVDVAKAFTAPLINLTPCSDVTTITAATYLTRVVCFPFTAEFTAAHPTLDLQTRALAGMCKGEFTAMAPVVVDTLLEIIDPVCP